LTHIIFGSRIFFWALAGGSHSVVSELVLFLSTIPLCAHHGDCRSEALAFVHLAFRALLLSLPCFVAADYSSQVPMAEKRVPFVYTFTSLQDSIE
jgi:hypothetical protein